MQCNNEKKKHYSAYVSEREENAALRTKHAENVNRRKSHVDMIETLFRDKNKQIDQLKNDLSQATSELNELKQATEISIPTTELGGGGINLLLEQKDAEIEEYVKIINEKDNLIAFQRPCCPVCMTDLDENRQWIAFHRCGHRTCSDCFDNLPPTAEKTKLCPICRTVITVSVTLAVT